MPVWTYVIMKDLLCSRMFTFFFLSPPSFRQFFSSRSTLLSILAEGDQGKDLIRIFVLCCHKGFHVRMTDWIL